MPKCSIMSGCGTRIVLRGQKPLALCDRCPCFGSLFPPLAALTFAASSIICALGLASAAPRSPYRHLELCGIALSERFFRILSNNIKTSRNGVPPAVGGSHSGIFCFLLESFLFHFGDMLSFQSNNHGWLRISVDLFLRFLLFLLHSPLFCSGNFSLHKKRLSITAYIQILHLLRYKKCSFCLPFFRYFYTYMQFLQCF